MLALRPLRRLVLGRPTFQFLDAGASHARSYIMFLTTITDDAFADGVRQADFDSESGRLVLVGAGGDEIALQVGKLPE